MLQQSYMACLHTKPEHSRVAVAGETADDSAGASGCHGVALRGVFSWLGSTRLSQANAKFSHSEMARMLRRALRRPPGQGFLEGPPQDPRSRVTMFTQVGNSPPGLRLRPMHQACPPPPTFVLCTKTIESSDIEPWAGRDSPTEASMHRHP